eukprot:TRINITY_DN3412_c0_g1_i13.p1 TRINITY_DN3412_c0_g1~~TRINITY_DN3412_c0_g1_i13.p1  ORF type:complete len:109 (-),score=25.32 TRINITY_DN3412_c0_g1_i13:289-615(-)
MTSRRASPLLSCVALAAALCFMAYWAPAFLPAPGEAPSRTAAVAAAAGVVASPLPAFAGEPPSVGEHWYWDLGIGSLHGETASIILLVFGLLVIFSVLGAGGSSRRAA